MYMCVCVLTCIYIYIYVWNGETNLLALGGTAGSIGCARAGNSTYLIL